MTAARPPVYQVRVALRTSDGRLRSHTRLCWLDRPSAISVLNALARRAADGRRQGLTLVVVSAPPPLGTLLALAGLDGVLDGLLLDGSGELGGQAEAREQ